MGTEYYIIKPDKKEKYYLGKGRWYELESLNCYTPQFIRVEHAKELVVNLLDILTGCELYLEQIYDIACNIYEWCDAPVYLANDCGYDFKEICNYTETGSITTVYETFRQTYNNLFDLEEKIDTIVSTMLPSKYASKHTNPIECLVEYIKDKEKII